MGDPVLRAGEETLATLRRSIDELKKIDAERRAQPELELRMRQEALAEKLAELSVLRQERRRLDAKVSELEEQSVAWVRKWRDTQRKSAIGEKFPSIRTLDGRVYADAEIVAVTSAGIEVRHASGTARVRCDQLPSEWSERFVWSASEQEGVLAAERERAAELDRQVTARVEIAEDRERKRQAAEEAAASRAALARMSRQSVAATSAQSSSPLAEPARQIGGRRYYYYRDWDYRDRRYSSRRYYDYRPSVSCPNYGVRPQTRPPSTFFSSRPSSNSNCRSAPSFRIEPHSSPSVRATD